MNFKMFIEHNYIMILELIGLLITVYISAHLSEKTKKYARITIILLLITIVVQTTETIILEFPNMALGRHFLTSTKYSIYPIILMCVIKVVSPFKIKINNKLGILFWAPEIISIPLYYSSQWTKLISYFSVGSNNIAYYQSGPLQYWPYAIFVIYLVVFLVFNIMMIKKYARSNKIILGYICITSVVGIILYLTLEISDDYTPIFTAALLLYYLFLYIHLSTIDPLTRLLNRQSYVQDFESRGNKIEGVIYIDMNELKYLNDNFGHDKGDEALKTVAGIIQDYSGKYAIQYRVGGDEFIVLYKKATEESLINNIKVMKAELEKTEYSCAFGYAIRKETSNLQSMIVEADEKMFIDKELLKEEKAKKGETLNLRD